MGDGDAIAGSHEAEGSVLSEGDEHLLRFVVGRGDAGVEHWEAWVAAVGDIDEHSRPSFPMFPAAFARLDELGIDHEWLPRLRGAYRKEWVTSRVVESATKGASEVLDAAGVDHLVPIGAAVRQVTDAPLPRWDSPRLVVRWRDAPAALDALREAGWTEPSAPARRDPRAGLRRLRVLERRLRGPDDTEIVLADHLIHGRPGRRAGERVWGDARRHGPGRAHLPATRDLAQAAASYESGHESDLAVALLRLDALASSNGGVLEITTDRTPWHPADPLIDARLARLVEVTSTSVVRSEVDDRPPGDTGTRLGDVVAAVRRWGVAGLVRTLTR